MKKLILLIAILAGSLQADFIRVWGGGNLNAQKDYHIWALGKHFLPIIPNVRVEYTQMVNIANKEVFAYYNFLDNTLWTTLDLGVGISEIEGKIEPSAFVRARMQAPLTSFGAEIVMKMSALDIEKYQDTVVKIDYTLLDLVFVDIALEVGYRQSLYALDMVQFQDSQAFVGASLRL